MLYYVYGIYRSSHSILLIIRMSYLYMCEGYAVSCFLYFSLNISQLSCGEIIGQLICMCGFEAHYVIGFLQV